MIIPPFKPREYTAIVDKWVAEHRKPRRKMYLLIARKELKGKWQHFKPGKEFIGYRERQGWHVIALKMRVRFPVSMLCIPNSSLEIIAEVQPPQECFMCKTDKPRPQWIEGAKAGIFFCSKRCQVNYAIGADLT